MANVFISGGIASALCGKIIGKIIGKIVGGVSRATKIQYNKLKLQDVTNKNI